MTAGPLEVGAADPAQAGDARLAGGCPLVSAERRRSKEFQQERGGVGLGCHSSGRQNTDGRSRGEGPEGWESQVRGDP